MDAQPQMIGRISSPFGIVDSAHPNPHTGLDVAMDEGTRILCLQDGRVVFRSIVGDGSQWADVFGNSCIVEHQDGTRALYAHMSHQPTYPAGVPVKVGNTLGFVGHTGQATGPHLHLGLANTALNPWFQRDADGGITKLLDPLANMA